MFTTIALKSWISVQAALLLAFTTPFHELVDGASPAAAAADHGLDHQLHVPLPRGPRRRGDAAVAGAGVPLGRPRTGRGGGSIAGGRR